MGSALLCASALLSFVVAALHIVIIAGGAPAYRYTDAGEMMVRLAEQGSMVLALVTSGALVVFVLAGLYPLSAAGWGPRLPFPRLGLVCIAAVYTVRGLALVAQLAHRGPTGAPARAMVFSAISLSIGLVYIAAIATAWEDIRAGIRA
jgi:hypothetical protein